MINLKERALEVLQKGHLMSLGTLDSEGVWVADLVYVFDEDLNLYWISSAETRHSKAILGDSRVAATVTVGGRSGEPNFCLQISGRGEKIDGPRYHLALKDAKKRNKPEPKPEDDILRGRSWYKLTSERIELIDEENFGYKRQKVR